MANIEFNRYFKYDGLMKIINNPLARRFYPESNEYQPISSVIIPPVSDSKVTVVVCFKNITYDLPFEKILFITDNMFNFIKDSIMKASDQSENVKIYGAAIYNSNKVLEDAQIAVKQFMYRIPYLTFIDNLDVDLNYFIESIIDYLLDLNRRIIHVYIEGTRGDSYKLNKLALEKVAEGLEEETLKINFFNDKNAKEDSSNEDQG